MKTEHGAQESMDGTRTCTGVDTNGTRRRSLPVRYELIDKDGKIHGPFKSLEQAVCVAWRLWPNQSQDEDRTGRGWDVQVCGADR